MLPQHNHKTARLTLSDLGVWSGDETSDKNDKKPLNAMMS